MFVCFVCVCVCVCEERRGEREGRAVEGVWKVDLFVYLCVCVCVSVCFFNCICENLFVFCFV